MIELSAESVGPRHASDRVLIPRGSLAAACLAGMAIGVVEWLLGQPTGGFASFVWTTAFFGVLSTTIALVALCTVKLRAKVHPLWIWTWLWMGFYAVIYANLTILPQQGFLTSSSIALSLVSLTLAGVAAWAMAGFAKRIPGLARVRKVPRAMHPTEFLIVLVALGIVFGLPIARSRSDLEANHSPRAPGDMNAVVILIDTLRADHLSTYGYRLQTTPNIDALAAEGVRFDAAYSSSSWTVPAVASLFSGLPLSQHRTGSVETPFEIEPTLAQQLSAAGLVTAGFSANPLVSPLYGFDRGFQTFVSYRSGLMYRVLELSAGTTRELLRWATDFDRILAEGAGNDWDRTLVNMAKDWLQGHRTDRFFLYLHLFAPHGPYAPPEPYRELWVDPTYEGIEYQGVARGTTLAPAAHENLLQRYDAEVAYVDSLVGEILDQIAQLQLSDSTAVFITSDHGEAFGEHGNWGHGQSLYVEETRVPLAARLPGGPAGLAVHEPVSIRDLYVTILEILSSPTATMSEGQSLKRRLHGDLSLPMRPVISEVIDNGGLHLNPSTTQTIEAVTMGEVRLIRNITLGKTEIFDRSTDPAETHPLQNPPVASMLEAYFAPRWWESAEGVSARKVALTEADIRRLQSLGYIR